MNLKLDWCSHKAAIYACEHWHYSKSIPTSPILKIGIWEDDKFKGVIIFSPGACRNLLIPYGVEKNEGCELTRIAMREHETPVSKCISIAMKMLKKSNPGIKIIVSYADPEQKHYGGIYQASNWIYTGKSSPSIKYKGPDGKLYHSRMISKEGYNIQYGEYRKVFKPSQCEIIRVQGKHRYIYPLTEEIREKIEPLRKPYPKNASIVQREQSETIREMAYRTDLLAPISNEVMRV